LATIEGSVSQDPRNTSDYRKSGAANAISIRFERTVHPVLDVWIEIAVDCIDILAYHGFEDAAINSAFD